jgi:DNA-binding NarL/FixJ family response regulator
VTPSLAAGLLGEWRERAAQPLAEPDPLAELTRREREILELVALGLSNKEIAGRLKLTEKTVKYYMTNVLQKLHVRNRVEAAVLARQGLHVA